MNINLVKFGNTLVFRDKGKEAFSAFQPELRNVKPNEEVTVNFEGVLTFSPSWGDEFLTPLHNEFGTRLFLLNTKNSSVQATLDILKRTKNIDFQVNS